jgi:lactate 2-monooxygenase
MFVGTKQRGLTIELFGMRLVAAEFKATPGFFQLDTPTDRELAASLVERADRAGFKAIVVTLDTWVTGWRPRDLATANFPQLRGLCLANYFSDPRFTKLMGGPPEKDPRAAVATWATIFGNPPTWDDLPWLRSLTKLPLIVKGICHPDDNGVRSTAASTESTAPIMEGARRTAAFPRSTCCPR